MEATAKVDVILATQTASAFQPVNDYNNNDHGNYNHNNDSELHKTAETDRWLARKLESERVSAQLSRKLEEIARQGTQGNMHMAQLVARAVRKEVMNVRARYTDPSSLSSLVGDYGGVGYCGARSSSALSYVLHRQYRGGGRRIGGPVLTTTKTTSRALSRLCGSIVASRISHAATVNCHLFYPVYCLRFDRTGQYFVTGADDQLVKVFRLGAFSSSSRKRWRQHPQQTENNATTSTTATNPEVLMMGDNYHDTEDRDGEAKCYRGAVLVCTLRGHAAVITDIDVSSDNALLATASEDGDVRIWGMENGCPVAILRGHKGGANMVSWSVMTPFRLVTAGDDGLARMWDIREAALKRCAAVRSRKDYTSPNLGKDTDKRGGVAVGAGIGEEGEASVLGDQDVASPPLPTTVVGEVGRASIAPILPNESRGLVAAATSAVGGIVETPRGDNANELNIPLPPLPGAAADRRNNPVQAVAALNQNRNRPAPGAFIAGDQVDEGVHLLYKLQHSDINATNDPLLGPGTRSRSKDIRVVCLSRCPVGGHFATGSDDGVGRIWLDEDDGGVERLDETFREQNSCISGRASLANIFPPRKACARRNTTSISGNASDVVPSASRLLACLSGHKNCITDIEYSHDGDRLLTASQNDGVVRVWSWRSETSMTSNAKMKIDGLQQVLISLTPLSHCNNPGRESSTARSSSSKRRRTTRGVASTRTADKSARTFCDLAMWTSNDSKIVTSQSCPLKETGTEIIPGSHVLHVWDSWTGLCLVGLPSAHNSSCPVLISHPLDSDILVSAGLDGYLKVWNLDKGECIFSHRNELQYGAMEVTNDRGKVCGYLDGNFSPDGLSLVLTDDMGRITLVDVLQSVDTSSSVIATSVSSAATSLPEWMKEQYFASDYYDLFYDASGYCIEVGSQQPPHLAPLAARCDHGGAPYSESVQESFRRMRGPASILEQDVRLGRDTVRCKSYQVRREGGMLAQNCRKAGITHGYGNVASLMGNIDGCGTVLPYSKTSGGGEGVARLGGRSPSLSQAQRQTGASSTRPINAARTPSSNYRWIDYDDMMREDEWRNPGGGSDDDEDEYHETPHRPSDDESLDSRSTMDNDVDEQSNFNASDMSASPHRQPQRRRTPATTARSSRSSRSFRSSRSYIHPPPRRQGNLGRRSRRNNSRHNLSNEDTDDDNDNDVELEEDDVEEEEVVMMRRTPTPTTARSSRRLPPRQQRNLGERQNSLATRSRRNNSRLNLSYEDTDDDDIELGEDADDDDIEPSEDDDVEEEVIMMRRTSTTTSRSSRRLPPRQQRNLGERPNSLATRPRRNNSRRNSSHEDTDDDDIELGEDADDDDDDIELGEDDDVEEEVVTMTQQPTRVSSRQQHAASIRRMQYEDNGSSDGSEVEELITRNKRPSKEHAKDYTDIGHLWKLPSSGKVNRGWVTRQECLQGWCGNKSYTPQVGDSIVYIARAHNDTLKEFQRVYTSCMSTPWKSWPTTSPWPVVRCLVTNIRYRFPYKIYYTRGASNRRMSVVAILTLEITGIPVFPTDRDFPWPEPKFVDRVDTSGVITFDVSTFISKKVDFIVPEQLYLWRLRTLEDAWRRRESDKEIVRVN